MKKYKKPVSILVLMEGEEVLQSVSSSNLDGTGNGGNTGGEVIEADSKGFGSGWDEE